jgi:hypothetical protein
LARKRGTQLAHSCGIKARIFRLIEKKNGLSAVKRPEGILDYNRHYINDLPVTRPHGSDFGAMRKILNLQRPEADTWHSSGTP